MIASLTWPCTLPPGWSVEWDGPSAGADHPPTEWHVSYGLYRCVTRFASSRLLLPLQQWDMNNLCSLDFCSTLLLWTWFIINFLFRCKTLMMYEMFCVVISELTFMWVLSVRSWNSVALIEASLEELPVRAELGQSCLATKISAPGPSILGGSATAGIRTRRQPTRAGNLGFQNNNLKFDFKTTKVFERV